MRVCVYVTLHNFIHVNLVATINRHVTSLFSDSAMPRHADYGGHRSRPRENERDFNDDYHWSDKHAMKHNDRLTTNTVSFVYAQLLGEKLCRNG